MDYTVANAYRDIRSLALSVTGGSLGVTDTVFGVVMDTAYPEAVVTLVALVDGTASLYFSNGGGIIGAGVALFAIVGVSGCARNLRYARTANLLGVHG